MMQRFMRFMYGRYGMDELNFFLLVFAMVVLIIAIFVPVPASLIIRLIALAATAFAVFIKSSARGPSAKIVLISS